MTHEYTLLLGGTVIPGGGEPDVTAIAWADDTILALGGDVDVRGISRGDSHVFDLGGACVVPLGPGDTVAGPGDTVARPGDAVAGPDTWPAGAALEVGGPADLVVLDGDPRVAGPGRTGAGATAARTLAVIRGGRVVAGALPGGTGHAPGA